MRIDLKRPWRRFGYWWLRQILIMRPDFPILLFKGLPRVLLGSLFLIFGILFRILRVHPFIPEEAGL